MAVQKKRSRQSALMRESRKSQVPNPVEKELWKLFELGEVGLKDPNYGVYDKKFAIKFAERHGIKKHIATFAFKLADPVQGYSREDLKKLLAKAAKPHPEGKNAGKWFLSKYHLIRLVSLKPGEKREEASNKLLDERMSIVQLKNFIQSKQGFQSKRSGRPKNWSGDTDTMLAQLKSECETWTRLGNRYAKNDKSLPKMKTFPSWFPELFNAVVNAAGALKEQIDLHFDPKLVPEEK